MPVQLDSIIMTFRREISAEGGSDFMEEKIGGMRQIPGSLGLEGAFEALKEPMILAINDGAEAVDVGAALRLQMRQKGLFADGQSLPELVYPLQATFKTYNIWVVHFMKYAVKYTVAGKTHEVRFEVMTDILPSTNDDEAPPAFDQTMDDDAPPPAFEAGPSAPVITGDTKTRKGGIKV